MKDFFPIIFYLAYENCSMIQSCLAKDHVLFFLSFQQKYVNKLY